LAKGLGSSTRGRQQHRGLALATAASEGIWPIQAIVPEKVKFGAANTNVGRQKGPNGATNRFPAQASVFSRDRAMMDDEL
jgi:hypothetical protein